MASRPAYFSAGHDFFESPFYSIANFPPQQALPREILHVKYINTINFTGIRFLVPGYYIETQPAKQPTYIFQGITKDNKHYLHFKYEDIYSEKLNELIRNDPNYKYGDDNWIKWVNETYSAIKTQKDNEFLPSLDELDRFIKSIKIN